MPRGDRTGPDGWGPRTGRAAGYCSGYDRPGFMNPAGARGGFGPGYGSGYGRGFGRGFGFHRGNRPFYGGPAYYSDAPVNEKDYLEQEISTARDHIELLEKRLNSLKDPENT